MDKRATNKDVAKMAGVSVATVSYVVNGRTDKRIPEETRKKVLHAVNFLNYKPNPFAVGLSANLAHNIVVRAASGLSPLGSLEILSFLVELNQITKAKNYSVYFSPDNLPEKLSALACVCFGMSRGEFHALGNENFIPLIAVDCLINDPVFYQITPDYAKIREAADNSLGKNYTYVAIEPSSKEIKSEILSVFDKTVFVSGLADINKSNISGKILLTNKPLFGAFNGEVFCYDAHLKARAEAAVKCIESAVSRENTVSAEHYIKI